MSSVGAEQNVLAAPEAGDGSAPQTPGSLLWWRPTLLKLRHTLKHTHPHMHTHQKHTHSVTSSPAFKMKPEPHEKMYPLSTESPTLSPSFCHPSMYPNVACFS